MSNATDDLIEQEKEALLKLEKWSMIEESALKQKSRIKWIQLGDANNKGICLRQQIRSITSLSGHLLTESNEIQQEFIQFYKGLMGTSAKELPDIDSQIMKRGPTLSRLQRMELSAEITEEDIYAGLQAIGNDKAPGTDGYNAFFLKKSWQVIKQDILAALHNFFDTGRIYEPINCTQVTLIAKVHDPTNVKEFRPIACCTTLYKIISKVWANRLHVISTVISENQAGFIPGRKISDNIILAHELIRAYTRKNISARCMLKVDLQILLNGVS